MVWLLVLKSLIIFLSQLLLNVSAQNGRCPPYSDCGFLGRIRFPFTTTEQQHCGLLAIHGCQRLPPSSRKTIKLGTSTSSSYSVLKVEPSTIFISDDEQQRYLENRSCKAFSNNVTLPHTSPLASFLNKNGITIFRCNQSLKPSLSKDFYKYSNCSEYEIFYGPPNTLTPPGFQWPSSLAPCSTVQLSVDGSSTDDPFLFVISTSVIEVQLSNECERCLGDGKGRCLLDTEGKFYCATGSRSWVTKMVLGLASAVTVILLIAMVKIYYTRRKKQNPTNQRIEVFLKKHGALQTKRYGYSEIKKVTNCFRNKLGQGGFGSVYKGKLQDGRYVAVKILNELKDDGEEFINEVASISRTSHINIVTLLGFCCDGFKRALIYEFMCNGSLEKLICQENALITHHQLDYQMLYHIAIGVARGLEYLHKGCNTRILHFDIKPHNILLDENFNPKISDFGLAKICSRKESMVSIFGARGTAGYIAPEVFSRNFGVVSHKSDVYSYGMMILEMIGGKKNTITGLDPSSEIYFPDWIYNRIESKQELGLQNMRNISDEKLVRKMAIVGLWCIQTHPSARPAISKVLEMLESKVELLQIPPKPVLSSPSTSPIHLSSETL
ncbi:LEAF RUST 10 DISEASE-RESISTANCE LOCUS RECEPTOR-LIKE PROTEIN KINASE-like 2.5 [Vigna radiata var. radiata]|uniref:non-specific serine/threonine protein kinase n=1 Tax=Vigna radiata var. radiata TaxID=3916 RepID=A0A1S3V106_VIGRR|nr:LEAF RUST 10 DISEASE-RESISTANCE LOCUS RECEPTOR-LIKE PROTEIN KINASE-like 2.5 [Vigna radiata var. radiata]